MRIMCLVSDLPGRLLKIGNEMSAGVSEQNQRALREFYRQGGHVAIASSRGLDARQMIEQQIGFPVKRLLKLKLRRLILAFLYSLLQPHNLTFGLAYPAFK